MSTGHPLIRTDRALVEVIERGEPRHHKDGSRCYSVKCGRAHKLTPAVIKHAQESARIRTVP